MCMFCAAIPAATAVGTALDNQQRRAAAGVEGTKRRPIMRITAAVVVALLMASITYHTLTFRP